MQARLLALTVIAGFLVASVALAQSKSSSSQDRSAKIDRHFAYTDKNGDGVIGRDEAARYPALVKHFGVIDSNKDGKLSKEEMRAYTLGTHGRQRAANAGRKSRASEDDGNGALTKADPDDGSAALHKNF
jgi:Ca2+-binding EF-hand superfamily protein